MQAARAQQGLHQCWHRSFENCLCTCELPSSFVLQARAQDTSLQTLINAGTTAIAQGQAQVESLLQQIIGKQNQAAAAAQQAARALAAIQDLQSQQAQAQQDIAAAVQSQVTAIQVSGFLQPWCPSTLAASREEGCCTGCPC